MLCMGDQEDEALEEVEMFVLKKMQVSCNGHLHIGGWLLQRTELRSRKGKESSMGISIDIRKNSLCVRTFA